MVAEDSKDSRDIALALSHSRDLLQKKRHESGGFFSLLKDFLHHFCDNFIVAQVVIVWRHHYQGKIQLVRKFNEPFVYGFQIVANIVQHKSGFADFMEATDGIALGLHIIHHGSEGGDDKFVSQKQSIRHSKHTGIL